VLLSVPKAKVGTTSLPERPTAAVTGSPGAGTAPPSIGNNVFIVPKASPAGAAEHAARAASRPLNLPGPLDRAKDYVVDVADRAADRVSALSAQTETRAGEAAASVMFRTAARPGAGVLPGAGRGIAGSGVPRLARAAARLRKSADYKLLERYEKEIMTTAERLTSQKARVAIAADLERGVIKEDEAFSKIRTALNDAREGAGEFNATADLHSSFDVDDFVVVPARKNEVPVLDIALKLKRNSPLNAGKKFAFAEAKGGLNTKLGEVTAKRYWYRAGKLGFDPLPRRGMIRQSSGPWYYQKFAEIYMMGQELIDEGSAAAGRKLQSLANEMFEAATKGEIATVVAKSDVALERKFVDSTEQVVAWFKEQNWDLSRGFPVPR
jgi:hypothetical protein